MGLWVKTTIEVEDRLLQQAKITAAAEGVSLKALLEEALRAALRRRKRGGEARKRIVLPVSKRTGGTLPAVDLTNSASLEDLMNS